MTLIFYHSDKTKGRPLGSRLKQWNLLGKDVMILYRKRQPDIATYFSKEVIALTEITSKNKLKNCNLKTDTPLENGGFSLIHLRSV